MSRHHVYKLVRETKTKVLNITTSLILVGMSLGGALPVIFAPTANAAGATITSGNAALWNSSYKGITVDGYFQDLSDVSSYAVTIHRSSGSDVTVSATPAATALLDSGATTLTTPVFIQDGTDTAAAESTYWTQDPSAVWSNTTVPQTATITLVDNGSTVTSGPIAIVTNGINYTDLVPVAPTLTDGYFAIDNTGFNVGFDAHNFQNVSSVTVNLEKSDGTSIVENVGKTDLYNLINGKSDQAISTPFAMPVTATDDSYWDYGNINWTAADDPYQAVVTIVDDSGPTSITLSPYTHNIYAGSPNPVNFTDLLPLAAPTDLYVQYGTSGQRLDNMQGTSQASHSGTWHLHWTKTISDSNIKEYQVERTYPNGHVSSYTILPGSNPTPLYNFTNEGEGVYTYRIRVESTGNVWSSYSNPVSVIYDTIKQHATISAPHYVNGDFQVTMVAHDNVGFASLGVDVRQGPDPDVGSSWIAAPCTPSTPFDPSAQVSKDSSGVDITYTCTVNTSNLQSGQTYYLRAVGQDFAGQWFARASSPYATFTFDNAKPTISNLSAVVNPGTSGSRTYSLVGKNTPLLVKSGDTVTVTIKVDGTGSPVDWATVRAYEQNQAAGNYHTYLFQDVSMTDNGNGTYSYKFTVPDHYTPVPDDTSHTINQGQYKNVLDFNTKDEAGNTRGTALNFTIDNTAPTMDLRYGESGAIIQSGSTINNTGKNIRIDKENTATIHVTKPDGSTWTGGKKDASYSGGKLSMDWLFTQDGTYTFYVQDVAGNVSGNYTITIDTAAPTGLSPIFPLSTKVLNTKDLYIDWTDASDNLTPQSQIVYHYQLYMVNPDTNPGAVLRYHADYTGTSRHPVTGFANGTPEGTYWWRVQACDQAQNCVTTPAQEFIVDNTAPYAPTLVSPKDGAVVNGASITQSWSDSSSDIDHYVYESYNDAGATSLRWREDFTTTSKTAKNVADGTTYWWRVTAVDKAGNESAPSPPWRITVDNKAPVVAITAPSDGDSLRGTVTVSGTVTDTNPDHYYFVVKDSAGKVVAGPGVVNAATVSDWSWDTSKVKDGTYTIDLEARDAAGNKGTSSTQTITVTVDNSGPALTIDPVSSSTATTPTITGTTSDPSGVKTVVVTVNGHDYTATVTGTTWSATVTDPLAVGSYTASVTSRDTLGNGTVETAGFNVTAVTPANPAGTPPTTQSQTTFNVTPNNDQTAAPQVLGAAAGTDAANTSNSVKGDSINLTNSNSKDKTGSNSAFLGLGWWWLLILAAIAAALGWFTASRRANQE